MDKSPLIDYLQNILEIIGRNANSNYEITLNQVEIYFKNKYTVGIPLADLRLVVNRLEKDGYVTQNATGAHVCKITFDGILFLETGGYKEQKRRDDFNVQYLETDQRIRRRNESWTSVGAVAAAVIAGILLLFDVSKVLYHHRYFFCR